MINQAVDLFIALGEQHHLVSDREIDSLATTLLVLLWVDELAVDYVRFVGRITRFKC